MPARNNWQDAIIDTREVSGYDTLTHTTTIQGHFGFWISLEEKETRSLHSDSERSHFKLYVSSEKPSTSERYLGIAQFGDTFIECTWQKNRRKNTFNLTEKKSLLPLYICLDPKRTRFLDDFYAIISEL